jgi:hypothetical protein
MIHPHAVFRLSRLFCLAAVFGAAWAPARAATLLHEYALRGTLDDNQGGPALSSLGGQITALGYVFAANQGLTLTSPALNATSFSLELSFHFDATSGYRKIADFHDRADDSGFYVLNSALNFYPVVTASAADFVAGVDVHVVLTRDAATNVVVGYVNGQQRFTFTDTQPFATFTGPTSKLTLFTDDFATSGEASGGTVNYVRVFNGPLTASEVNALYAAGAPLAVPEPAALPLLAAGVIAVGCFGVQRGRNRFVGKLSENCRTKG